MLRQFDLSVHEQSVYDLLNDPYLRLVSLQVSCSEETGYTVVTLRLAPSEEEIPRKFTRYVRRFSLLSGTFDPEIDEILSDKKYRLLKQHVFPTSEGTVVVLDYQVRNER